MLGGGKNKSSYRVPLIESRGSSKEEVDQSVLSSRKDEIRHWASTPSTNFSRMWMIDNWIEAFASQNMGTSSVRRVSIPARMMIMSKYLHNLADYITYNTNIPKDAPSTERSMSYLSQFLRSSVSTEDSCDESSESSGTCSVKCPTRPPGSGSRGELASPVT